MQANLNAFSLIFLFIFGSLIIWKFSQKPYNFKPTAISLFLLYCVYFLLKPNNMCGVNPPLTHWAIPLLFSSIFLMTIRSKPVKLIFVGCIVSLSFVINLHYVSLVCGDDYTDHPTKSQSNNIKNELELIELKDYLQEEAINNLNYYHEGKIVDTISDIDLSIWNKRRFHFEIIPTWHSFFSKIYEIRKTPIVIWYPGGNLKDSLNQIKYTKQPGFPPTHNDTASTKRP